MFTDAGEVIVYHQNPRPHALIIWLLHDVLKKIQIIYSIIQYIKATDISNNIEWYTKALNNFDIILFQVN